MWASMILVTQGATPTEGFLRAQRAMLGADGKKGTKYRPCPCRTHSPVLVHAVSPLEVSKAALIPIFLNGGYDV